MWDKTKSNWRNKSELGESRRVCPALEGRLLQVTKLLYSLCPSVKRVRTESEQLNSVKKKKKPSQRTTPCWALRPCITGCRDDEVVRGCLSHHHPPCSFTHLALPLLRLPLFSALLPNPLMLVISAPEELVYFPDVSDCTRDSFNNHLQFFSPVCPSCFRFCSLLLAVGVGETLVKASTFTFGCAIFRFTSQLLTKWIALVQPLCPQASFVVQLICMRFPSNLKYRLCGTSFKVTLESTFC